MGAKSEIIEKLIDYILDDHYDFIVVDYGGARGENLFVEEMTLRNEKAFREGLKKILEKNWRIA